MKYWTAQEIGGGDVRIPGKVKRIVAAVHDAIDEHGRFATKLIRVGRTDDVEEDFNRYEVDIELAPGVVLPTAYGTIDGLNEGWEDKAGDIDGIVALVTEGLIACEELIGPLADTLDELRRRARAIIAGWQRSGLPTALVDVRLQPLDAWRGSTTPATSVFFEGLDDRLQRCVMEAQVEEPADLARALVEHSLDLEQRHLARIALADRGASGTIDQLALNAIAQFGDVAAGLRRFGSTWRYWLPDSTALIMDHGHVTAGTGVARGAFDWSRSSVTVSSLHTGQSELDAAIGKPVTELIEHEFLSADMIVTQATSVVEEGRTFVVVRFDQPHRLFCSVTGRVWDDVADMDGSGSVVAFRAREA